MDRKKTWLRLFFKFWGYAPVSKIRKSRDYAGIMSLQEAISYFSEFNIPCQVQVVFPFASSVVAGKKKHDCLIIFPQAIKLKLPLKKTYSTFEIDEPILFNNEQSSLQGFLSKAPEPNPYFETGTFNSFTFPLNYFLLTTSELTRFKKSYLKRLSKIIVDAHDLEGRGKKGLTAIEKERRSVIVKEHRRLGSPERIRVKEIQEALEEYIKSRYGVDSEKGSLLRCTDMTIYRTLKP